MKLEHRSLVRVVAILVATFLGAAAADAYVLVADRPENRILKYSDSGNFLGTVFEDDAIFGGIVGNNHGPAGLTLSPDGTHLYASSLNNSVIRFDFDGTTASNPQVYTSNGQSTILGPASLIFSQDGSTLYVSNRGPLANQTHISQLTPGGVSAGPDISGGPGTGRTGLAYNSAGDLLVGAFGWNFSPNGLPGGGVLRYDAGSNQLVDLIPQNAALAGATVLLVNGDDLYVVAAGSNNFFRGAVGKFNALTGALDTSFGANGYLVPGDTFPAAIAPTADGTGFLLGMVDVQTTGEGRVDQYLWDGTLVGNWALPSANAALGFFEASALLHVVPEPATLALAGVAGIALVVRRRVAKQA